MGYGDLVRNGEIVSNTIIEGNIDENVSIMPIFPKIVTFMNISGENVQRVIDEKTLIANVLWEII